MSWVFLLIILYIYRLFFFFVREEILHKSPLKIQKLGVFKKKKKNINKGMQTYSFLRFYL